MCKRSILNALLVVLGASLAGACTHGVKPTAAVPPDCKHGGLVIDDAGKFNSIISDQCVITNQGPPCNPDYKVEKRPYCRDDYWSGFTQTDEFKGTIKFFRSDKPMQWEPTSPSWACCAWGNQEKTDAAGNKYRACLVKKAC